MNGYQCKPTGLFAIDMQHQRLIDAFVRLEAFSQNKHSFAAALDALTFLRSYLVEHFEFEEKELADRNYPKLPEHKELHRKIAADVEQLWADFEKGDDISEHVIQRMRWWIVDHINVEDAAFADFIAAVESASK